VNTWRLIGHHFDAEEAINWCRTAGRIAVGWGDIGDLRKLQPKSAEDISAAVRETCPEATNSHLAGPSLWRLFREMAIGDLVIVGDGNRRRIVMKVTGGYEFSVPPPFDPDGYQHQRTASFTQEDPDDLWQRCGATEAEGENRRWTLFRCGLLGDT